MNAPAIDEVDQWYLNAFWHLSSTRSHGMGQGPIPWDKTMEYADRAGLDAENARALALIVREMDSAYLAWHAQDAEDRRLNRK